MVLLYQRFINLLLLNFIFFATKVSAPTNLTSTLSSTKIKEEMNLTTPETLSPPEEEDYLDESIKLLNGENSNRSSIMDIFLMSNNNETIKTTTTTESQEPKKSLLWFWITLGSALFLFFALLFLGVFALIWRIKHGETVKDILWTK